VLHKIAAILLNLQKKKAITDSSTTARNSSNGDDLGQASEESQAGDVNEEEQMRQEKSVFDESTFETIPEEGKAF
jgi:hypothetical protein